MKKLIVNADDFGYSEGVNKGIIKSFKDGIVTSTSLITDFPGFKSAINLAKKHKIDTGIHLNLTENKFSESFLDFLRGRFSAREIEYELEEQINKVEDAGLRISHIDGHQHVHVFPKIFKIIVKLAKEHGIKHVRLPHERIALNSILFSSLLNGQFTKKVVLSSLSLNKRKLLAKNGLETTDNFYGLLTGKGLTYTKMATILKCIKQGTTELVCHPAVENYADHLDRVKEMKILTHDNIKTLINDLDIKLTNYKSL